MKRFEQREISEAVAHAAGGGQALHVCDTRSLGVRFMPHAPAVFKRSQTFAHLFDQDATRLRATARRLGVRVIVLGRTGTPRQHVDLCGGPLERAVAEAAKGAS